MSDKCLVMFCGGVETQEFFSYELAKEFDRLGYRIFFYNLMSDELSFRQLKAFVEDARRTGSSIYMLSFNFNGLAGERFLYADDGSVFWDTQDIPCMNIVLDHPFYYHKYIAKLPVRYRQVSIDKNHEAYMKRFFPEIKLAGFLPLAGTMLETGEDLIPWEERPMDIVMTGNYTRPETFDRYIAHLDREYRDFYHEILDVQLANPDKTLEQIAEPMLVRELDGQGSDNGKLSDDDIKSCYANMIFIDLWARFHYRGMAVAELADAGFRVDVFGAGWEALECRCKDNIICHGPGDSKKCLEALAQARVGLNVMPWFKDGAHDRIFNTMLNGAAVLTDVSRYLNQILTDGKDAVFYSLKGRDGRMSGLVEGAHRLLNSQYGSKVAHAGMELALSGHTWAHRARTLDDWLTLM